MNVASAARRGIAWTGIASVTMGVADVVATVVLLRYYLTPAEYGIASIATTLYPMFDLLADGGVAAAVVQHEDLDDERASTAWWVVAGISVIVAVVLCGLGPLLAIVQGHWIVAGLVSAYAIKLVLHNAYWVPVAMLRRDLQFKPLAKIRTLGSLAELAGKLGAAAAGLGVWCFVVGQLAKTVALGVGVQLVRPYRPGRQFSRSHARNLLRYGGRTMSSQVVFHLYTNADYQIVSFLFGPTATGLYRAAYELVLEPAKLLSYIVVDVAFPVYSRLRGDMLALGNQLVAFTRHNVIVLAPFVGAMLLIPEDLLSVAYGDAWRTAGAAARILAIVAALRALSYLLPPLLDAIGRVDLTLRYTVAAALIVPSVQLLAALLLGPRIGWVSVAIGWAIAYPIAFVLLVSFALRQARLPLGRYMATISEPAITAIIACMVALPVAARLDGAWLRIVAIGATIVATHGAALGALAFTRSRAQSTS